MSSTDLDIVESWFVSKGLPHLVERQPSAAQIWARSFPLLVACYVLVGFNALDLRRWSGTENVLVAVFVLVIAAATWIVANLARGRRPLERPHRIGTVELAVFVIGPAIPSIVTGQYFDALQTALTAVGVLAFVWAVTSYGVGALLGWAAHRAAGQVMEISNAVARALPLLLLFTTFLFINAEVWQVAGTLRGTVFVADVGVFFVLGTLFTLSRVPLFTKELNRFDSWAEIHDVAEPTPANRLARRVGVEPGERVESATELRPRQRFNVALVTLFPQAILITMVGVALTGFFVLFGFLAVSEATVVSWTQLDTVHVIARVHHGGRALVVTEPAIRVATFLGAFSAMYFTVVLATDATYRDEFAQDVGPAVRQALAAHAVYRRALAAEGDVRPATSGASGAPAARMGR